jgi:hypothetical protein
MNILKRLKKLESENPNKPPCFCNKTWVDLCYGTPGADALTYCPNCKDTFDFWAKAAAEAKAITKNLTDDLGSQERNEH